MPYNQRNVLAARASASLTTAFVYGPWLDVSTYRLVRLFCRYTVGADSNAGVDVVAKVRLPDGTEYVEMIDDGAATDVPGPPPQFRTSLREWVHRLPQTAATGTAVGYTITGIAASDVDVPPSGVVHEVGGLPHAASASAATAAMLVASSPELRAS